MNDYPAFFETNEYFIDQKVNFLKFESEYKVYNQSGEQTGFIKQKLSTSHKIISLLLGKAMMPFFLEIVDLNGNLLASVKRGWTFFMSEIVIANENNETIGYIKQKWAFMKPTFHIMDAQKNKIATIKGDWKAWNFTIEEPNGSKIGTVNKKWAGAAKEIFTSADKYNVSINENYQENTDKIVIVSTAITIDMVMKESK
ncbi:MAG: hypothetical protein RL662_1563 [Bacteroidota bacterium]|jgi:uncharacterized protein YxjI